MKQTQTLPIAEAAPLGIGFEDLLSIPKAKCEKCGSTNLKDTGSFLVEMHRCQDAASFSAKTQETLAGMLNDIRIK